MCENIMHLSLGSAVVLLVGLNCSAADIQTQVRSPAPLKNGSLTLVTGNPGNGYAIPCVADWNGDGKKDLLVGFQPEGQIALYLNRGTDSKPVFTNYTVLKTADGSIVQHSSTGCGAPAPWVCDFDGNGTRDLLVGDGADGTVWLYRNTNSNTNSAPTLATKVRLQAGASNLTVGYRATPYVCDWDQDGLPDLLCGNIDGYVWFFRNTNTLQEPIYSTGIRIQAGGADLRLHSLAGLAGVGRSVPRVFDWDGDGLRDLVCSSDGGVYWCQNTNSNAHPILMAPQPIYAPTTNGLVPIVTGMRMRLDLADWNNDGVMDLILGNRDGTVYYYEGYRFAFTRIASQPDGHLLLEWNSATNLKYDLVLTEPCQNSLPGVAVATNLPSGGNTTTWTNPLSSGQQFYRIQVSH